MKANIIVHEESTYWEADVLAEAFADCFCALGYEAKTWIGTAPNPKESEPEDIHMLVDFPAFRLIRKGWNNCQRRAIIFWNATRFHDSQDNRRRWIKKHWQSNVGSLDKIVDFIFDYDRHNCAREYERPALAIPCEIGYHKRFETRPKGRELYDACFLGWVYEGGRRDKILRELQGEFSIAVCRRMTGRRRDHTEPHKYVDRDATREALRSKLFLNVQSDNDNPTFTSNRIVQFGFSNRQCILSEPIPLAPVQFESRKHWLCEPLEGWSSAVRYLIDSQEVRESIAQSGYEEVRGNYRLADHLSAALETAGLV